MSDYLLGDKLGIREKYVGEDWTPAQIILPEPTDKSLSRLKRYEAGYLLPPDDLPEALAIWDPKRFARIGDMFTIGMYVVTARLAEIFSRFNLGEGGLTPLMVYQSDLVTPAKGEYWLLNFGARKNSFLPSGSNQKGYRIRSGGVAKRSGIGFTAGVEYWEISSIIEDGDVAVSPAALQGADLWVEECVPRKLFMSGDLAEALTAKKLNKVDFRLKQCRVIGG